LAVAPNPHYTLTALYGKILRALAKMPQDAGYRKYTEQIVNDRLKVVQSVRFFDFWNSWIFPNPVVYFRPKLLPIWKTKSTVAKPKN
jgi:hypothetical protein